MYIRKLVFNILSWFYAVPHSLSSWQCGQFSPLVAGKWKKPIGKTLTGACHWMSQDVTDPNCCQRSARGEKVMQVPSKMKALMSENFAIEPKYCKR